MIAMLQMKLKSIVLVVKLDKYNISNNKIAFSFVCLYLL